MSRTVEYLAVTAIGIALVLLMVKPMVEKTAESLMNSAAFMQEAIDNG